MIQQTDAIILAGGRGSRLGKITDNTPKPLLHVGGEIFLKTLVDDLIDRGFHRVIISIGYRKDDFYSIFDHYKNVILVGESEPLGTGGALLNVLHHVRLSDMFFVLNADTFVDFDFYEILQQNQNIVVGSSATFGNRYGKIIFDHESKQVKSLGLDNSCNSSSLTHTGVYCLKLIDCLEIKQHMKGSIEEIFLNKITNNKELYVWEISTPFFDFGIPDDYRTRNEVFRSFFPRPMLFLDRDGVINFDAGYTHQLKDLSLIEETKHLARFAFKRGFNIAIVTNQSGIARGLYSRVDVELFNDKIKNLYRASGINICAMEYCPHHPKYGSKIICDCRKPRIGMFERISLTKNISLNESLMIGDKNSDLLAGKKFGIASFRWPFDEADIRNHIVDYKRGYQR